jgi:hypothetical protein
MSESAQPPAGQASELVAVRYVGAQPLIINGQVTEHGQVVYLPPDEVATWPDRHPYYERVAAPSPPK